MINETNYDFMRLLGLLGAINCKYHKLPIVLTMIKGLSLIPEAGEYSWVLPAIDVNFHRIDYYPKKVI